MGSWGAGGKVVSEHGRGEGLVATPTVLRKKRWKGPHT